MFYLAILLAKFTNFIIRFLKLGAGYTWPGYVASLVYPSLLKRLRRLHGARYIFITGTNGKTTTSKLLSHILQKEGYRVIHNKSGANLMNGILSALILETSLFSSNKVNFCVFEVDELVLSEMLKEIEPDILVLLNISRDQLDRYGEVDAILDKWFTALKNLTTTNLVLDSTQEAFGVFAEYYKGPIFYFDSDSDSLHHTDLIGDYNAKNINAAATVGGLLGIGKERVYKHLADFSVAYGRGEVIEYDGKLYQVFLAKNPASFNNNLTLLIDTNISYDGVLFMLNDEVRDGRDVSWIYDVTADNLATACKNKDVFIGGSRCLDFAVRLHYAGVDCDNKHIDANLSAIFTELSGATSLKNIVVLPNYSAMLDVRKFLTGKEIL